MRSPSSMQGPGFGQSGQPSSYRYWTATQWLIVINIVAYVLDGLLGDRLSTWGCFQIYRGVFQMQIWRWVTFQFLHVNIEHILFNMVALYFFGPIVEAVLGKRLFVIFYLLCGCAGAAMLVALWMLGVPHVTIGTALIGASAGILGVMAAAARMNPRQTVQLWLLILPPISLKIVTLVAIYVGIALLAVIESGPNAGGEASHLGGAAIGYLLIPFFRARVAKSRPKHRFWRPGDTSTSILRDEFDS